MASLSNFTDVLDDIIDDSQPLSLATSEESYVACLANNDTSKVESKVINRPPKGTGQRGNYRSIQEIDEKYRDVFSYPYFNLIQSSVIDDALYSDKSIVVCAPTGSGKTVLFEMAIVQLLMELEDKNYNEDFKIIYMAPVKALCTERLTEWYPKFTKLGLLCIEVTGDTDVEFSLLKPYKIIITTPEKWDVLTRRWRDHRGLVEVVKLFMIDEVHILNDESRGPVLEAVVSRMKTIESSAQAAYRLELLENQLYGTEMTHKTAPSIRFIAVSATVSNPEDVSKWLETDKKPAVFYQFGDECRPVKLRRIVEGYHCPPGSSIFKFDILLNYKLWPIIQKYHCGKPTLIFCNTRKGVILTAETLSKELTINFTEEQREKLIALCSTIKNKKLQSLIMSGVGCHHAGLLIEERQTIERGFRNRDLPILITTTTLAMGVNLPAHLVIIKNTQQYVNGAYQEYSMSTVLQMIGRAGRPQFDTEATAVIMTRLADKARYQALVGGCEPLQSYLHKRLPENLNSEAALGTVSDVAQCVQWLTSTFLYVRAARDPKKYLNLPQNSPQHMVTKKIEDLCVIAMNGLASFGLIRMDETGCIQSTEAGRLMSIFYLDLQTMKQFMKIEGTESLEHLVALICESHELSDMYLRVDERRCLNALNRNKSTATIRFPMKGKITTKQMKLNCVIQAVLGCLTISDPSLNQEAMKIMRIADRVCKGLVAYVTNEDQICHRPQYYSAVLNSIILAKCVHTHLWEDSPFVSRQLKGIGPTFSTLLASAGKINFMLLEESHPRDLERIMNKGAPAGNVIRKQISLLPKYQLSILPIDENKVSIELELLNQNYLAENIEQLTAGSNHKCYIIVGDSENHILLLTSFNDKDLISVFNGIRTHIVKRILQNKHKIFAHCISTTFVGIDAHTEYVFNDLNPFGAFHETPVRDIVEKQTYITDIFKHRKRNCPVEYEKTQCKEKKRRVNTIMESFNNLKNTFETTSKNIQEQNINIEIEDHENLDKSIINYQGNINLDDSNLINDIDAQDYAIDCDDFVDDAKIDRMLAEIECEMYNKKSVPNGTSLSHNTNISGQIYRKPNSPSNNCQKDSINETIILHHVTPKTTNKSKRYKTTKVRSNYSHVDILEKRMALDDDDDKTIILSGKGFTETIKCQINKYMQEAEVKSKTVDINVNLLLEHSGKNITNQSAAKDNTASDDESVLSLTQKLEPCFENEEQTEAKSEITGTELELLSDSRIITTEKQKPSFEIENALCPNLENNEIKEPHMKSEEVLLNYKYKDVTHDNSCGSEKSCLILNDRGILSVTPKIDDHLRTNKTPADEVVTSSIDNYTNIVEKGKDKDFLIIKDKDMDEENNQISCDKSVVKQSNDEQNRFLYTKKETYESQSLENDLDEMISITYSYNKWINELKESIKLQSIACNTKELSQSNMIETNLNKNIPKASSKICINESIHIKNQIKIKTNDTRHMDEMKQNTVSNNFINESVLIPNKLNSIEQGSLKTSNVEAQKYPVTNLPIDNLNLAPCIALNNKISDERKFIANVATMGIENITMPLQNSFIINKSVSEIDICKGDIISKHSLIHDINEIDNAVMMNNTNSTVDQIKVESNQSEVSISDLIINSGSYVSGEYSKTNSQNNYSYTPTKIGVNSQNPQLNSSIHVVQSVKVNFNNTQVISAIQCRDEEFTYTYPSKTKYSTTNEIDKQNTLNTTSLKCKNLSKCNQDVSCIKIQNFNNEKLRDDRLGSEVKRNSINNIPYKESSKPKDTHNDCKTNLTDQSYSKTTEMMKQKSDDINKTKDVENTFKLKDDVIKSEDNIQNILKKYSTIVRQNTISGQTPTQTASFKNVATNNIPIKRPRQRSKISDLPKLEVSFPESIIGRNQIIEETTPIIEQIPFNEIVSSFNENLLSKNIVEEKLYENNNDTDTEQVYEAVDLETDKDYNMDLSLFNPKVLLQSTLDVKDQIIPPPPQFQDDPINSYKDDEFSENLSTVDNYSPLQISEFNYMSESNYNDTNSLEENFDATNLTASQEIETWILPEDDFVDDYSLNPTNSFIVQDKKSCSFDLPGSSKLPYKTRLGQYKFKPKDKLRKWE